MSDSAKSVTYASVFDTSRQQPAPILLLTEVFPPQHGGSGRWFYEVYSRLPQRSVRVVAGRHPGAEDFDATSALATQRLEIKMADWGICNARSLRQYWSVFRSLRRIVRQHSVSAIHVGRILPEGWWALMLRRLHGIPYCLYIHGEELNYARFSRELRFMMRRVLRGAHLVIANSRNTRRLVVDFAPSVADRIEVLHPGVDTTRFAPRHVAAADTSCHRRPVLLTVGRLQERKGHDTVIRALPRLVSKFPSLVYRIVGDGSRRPYLESLVAELEMASHVEFLGELDDHAMVRHYQTADLFVLANREVDGDIEGFGIVLLEAQACGCPVVAGKSGGTAETLIEDVTGILVECTSWEPLATRVERILSDDGVRRQMSARAREWVVQNFDWNALTQRAQSIFSRCKR